MIALFRSQSKAITGEVAEWPMARHWKCRSPQGDVGSNPTLSAIFKQKHRPRMVGVFVLVLLLVLVLDSLSTFCRPVLKMGTTQTIKGVASLLHVFAGRF